MTKFLSDYDITIIEFQDSVLPEALEQNDISVTKFLDRQIGQFILDNDISVTKFLDDNDISVTKFLADDYGRTQHHREHAGSWDEDLDHHQGHF